MSWSEIAAKQSQPNKKKHTVSGRQGSPRQMRVAIPAIIERVDHKNIGRVAVTICGLSIADIRLRHSVRMMIREKFTITSSGASQVRHSIRCIVTGCNAATAAGGFIVGAAFLEHSGIGR